MARTTLAKHTTTQTSEISREVLAALDGGRQIAPLSDGNPGGDLASARRLAAAVQRLREIRGERVVGRRIGSIWAEHGIEAPSWSSIYDTTVHRLADLGAPFSLSDLTQPRITPEIVFKLSRAPEPDMDEGALLSCVEWMAHGFGIAHSPHPGDCSPAADPFAFGSHGALLLGSLVSISPGNAERYHGAFAAFGISLWRDGVVADHGRATNVSGVGPLTALRHLVGVLARDPESSPLAAGEIVSTGLVARALPIAPGETWSTALTGLPLQGICVTLA